MNDLNSEFKSLTIKQSESYNIKKTKGKRKRSSNEINKDSNNPSIINPNGSLNNLESNNSYEKNKITKRKKTSNKTNVKDSNDPSIINPNGSLNNLAPNNSYEKNKNTIKNINSTNKSIVPMVVSYNTSNNLNINMSEKNSSKIIKPKKSSKDTVAKPTINVVSKNKKRGRSKKKKSANKRSKKRITLSENAKYKNSLNYLSSSESFYEDLILSQIYKDALTPINDFITYDLYNSFYYNINFNDDDDYTQTNIDKKGGNNSSSKKQTIEKQTLEKQKEQTISQQKESITEKNSLSKSDGKNDIFFKNLLNFADNCHDFIESISSDEKKKKKLVRASELEDIRKHDNGKNGKEWMKKYHKDILNFDKIPPNFLDYYTIIGSSGFEANFLNKYLYDNINNYNDVKQYMQYFNRYDKDCTDKISKFISLTYNNKSAYYIYDMGGISNLEQSLSKVNIKRADCFAKIWDPSTGSKINKEGKYIDDIIIGNNDTAIQTDIYSTEISLAPIYINKPLSENSQKSNINIKLSLVVKENPLIKVDIFLEEGLGLASLSIIAKNMFYYLEAKSRNKTYKVNIPNKLKYVYSKFVEFIDNDFFKDKNWKQKFEIIFKIILDMKRTGDHGMVKTVKFINEKGKNTFLLTDDALCATKAYNQKVPCLFSSFNFDRGDPEKFSLFKENNSFYKKLFKTIQQIYSTIKGTKQKKSSICFYKGALSNNIFDLKNYILPIFKNLESFDLLTLTNYLTNKNITDTNIIYKKILLFSLNYFNSKENINTDTNFIDTLNKFISNGIESVNFDEFTKIINNRNNIYLSLLEVLDQLFKFKFYSYHHTDKIINNNKNAFNSVVNSINKLNEIKQALQKENERLDKEIKKGLIGARQISKNQNYISENNKKILMYKNNQVLDINTYKNMFSKNSKVYIQKLQDHFENDILNSLISPNNIINKNFINNIIYYINFKYTDYENTINQKKIDDHINMLYTFIRQ